MALCNFPLTAAVTYRSSCVLQ